MIQQPVTKSVYASGRGRMTLTRRNAMIAAGACLAVSPVKVPPGRPCVITLSDETVAIAQDLVNKGYHRTIQEAVVAAIHAMMARDRQERSASCEEREIDIREGPTNFLAHERDSSVAGSDVC